MELVWLCPRLACPLPVPLLLLLLLFMLLQLLLLLLLLPLCCTRASSCCRRALHIASTALGGVGEPSPAGQHGHEYWICHVDSEALTCGPKPTGKGGKLQATGNSVGMLREGVWNGQQLGINRGRPPCIPSLPDKPPTHGLTCFLKWLPCLRSGRVHAAGVSWVPANRGTPHDQDALARGTCS